MTCDLLQMMKNAFIFDTCHMTKIKNYISQVMLCKFKDCL